MFIIYFVCDVVVFIISNVINVVVIGYWFIMILIVGCVIVIELIVLDDGVDVISLLKVNLDSLF